MSEAKRLCEVYKIIAEMNSIMCGIEGMKALNADRESSGLAAGYDDNAFAGERDELDKIAKKFERMAENYGKIDA